MTTPAYLICTDVKAYNRAQARALLADLRAVCRKHGAPMRHLDIVEVLPPPGPGDLFGAAWRWLTSVRPLRIRLDLRGLL
jgi:hypothetical protein